MNKIQLYKYVLSDRCNMRYWAFFALKNQVVMTASPYFFFIMNNIHKKIANLRRKTFFYPISKQTQFRFIINIVMTNKIITIIGIELIIKKLY